MRELENALKDLIAEVEELVWSLRLLQKVLILIGVVMVTALLLELR